MKTLLLIQYLGNGSTLSLIHIYTTRIPQVQFRKTRMPNKPVLYYIDLGPPSRSVLLTATAIGVELELRVMNLLGGDQLKPEFLKVCEGLSCRYVITPSELP